MDNKQSDIEPVNSLANGLLSKTICRYDKTAYRQHCSHEESLPLFVRDWWLDITCGDDWDALIIEENGCIAASMPVYLPAKGIVSMPSYTQTMGPWFATESDDTKYSRFIAKRQAMCKLFIDKLDGCSHFLQNFSHEFTDWLPFYWAGYQQTTRYTYLLDSIKDIDRLWQQMNANIRRNIDKAQRKHGLTVRKGVPIADLFQVQQQTFERQQLRNKQNQHTLEQLILHARERQQGEIWGAYDEKGNLHAAVFIAWQESCAYYIAGGANTQLRDSGAHSLVMWEAIREVSHYTDAFDFEGSMLPGVERFFREFGGIQTPFFTITKGGQPCLLFRIRRKLKNR